MLPRQLLVELDLEAQEVAKAMREADVPELDNTGEGATANVLDVAEAAERSARQLNPVASRINQARLRIMRQAPAGTDLFMMGWMLCSRVMAAEQKRRNQDVRREVAALPAPKPFPHPLTRKHSPALCWCEWPTIKDEGKAYSDVITFDCHHCGREVMFVPKPEA